MKVRVSRRPDYLKYEIEKKKMPEGLNQSERDDWIRELARRLRV